MCVFLTVFFYEIRGRVLATRAVYSYNLTRTILFGYSTDV
jgi:hypothetical protein